MAIQQLFDDLKTQLSTQSVTQPVTQSQQKNKKKRNEKTRHQYKRRSLQQANAEQIAEQNKEKSTEKEDYISSNSEAVTTKNKASSTRTKSLLSTISQQVHSAPPHIVLSTAPHYAGHHDTHHNTHRSEAPISIWPGISTCAMIWSTIALSKQEKDLLKRSQPVGPMIFEHYSNLDVDWGQQSVIRIGLSFFICGRRTITPLHQNFASYKHYFPSAFIISNHHPVVQVSKWLFRTSFIQFFHDTRRESIYSQI